jgi:ATP-dependent Clp protease adaptor protein ClpS
MRAVSAPSPVELDRPGTDEQAEEQTDDLTFVDRPWVTIVWNDPVNLMSYVSFVFQSYFNYSKRKAEKLMLEVHNDGRSVVSHGSREEMERDVQAMHEHGLWATMERDPT